MRKNIAWLLIAVFIICGHYPARASVIDWIKEKTKAVTSTRLVDTQIGAGLKEALRVGAENAIKALGQKDGYLGNQAVKILVPQGLQKAEPLLRKVGLGPKIDELTVSMNRAAEEAAPLAADIFATAITDMSINDANSILKGGDTAATDYFKARTYNSLLNKFQPAVNKTMKEYGITKKYDDLTTRLKALPVFSKFGENFDLNRYVSAKALDGLFLTLGEEEKKIRHDPSARATELIKEVFGK